jgi:hypothetical protein
MIPGAITMYLGLLLGLKFSLHTGIGPAYEYFSYILAIGPFILVYIFFNIENEVKMSYIYYYLNV